MISRRTLLGRLLPAALGGLAAGCTIGPRTLERTRLKYNEAVKVTSDEQLLLNIVRLRYVDSPSSLAVSTIAAQSELQKSLKAIPFFTSAGSDMGPLGLKSYTNILPQAELIGTERPTLSYTPLDDQEFTRKLFTPLTLEGIVYLCKTTWPVSTVLRLWLETLNHVDNAQSASGPTPKVAPEYADFLRGIQALQTLQDRYEIFFQAEERDENVATALPADAITAQALLDAAKNGYEYRKDKNADTWSLFQKKSIPVLRLHPAALATPEGEEFVRTFHLRPGLVKYDLELEKNDPFPINFPPEGLTTIDLEPRSLLQVLFFIAQGVEVPPEHLAKGMVTVSQTADGNAFDYQQVLGGLFLVRCCKGHKRPENAYVSTCYKGYWFYIDETDQDSKLTFALLMELSRLELIGKTSQSAPILTLPLAGR